MKKQNALFLAIFSLWVIIVSCDVNPDPAKGDPDAPPSAPTWSVTYHADDATAGTVPVDSTKYAKEAAVTVLEPGALARTGYAFAGWRLGTDPAGTVYAAGATLLMGEADIHLYATWTVVVAAPTTPPVSFWRGSADFTFGGTTAPRAKLGGNSYVELPYTDFSVTDDAVSWIVPIPSGSGDKVCLLAEGSSVRIDAIQYLDGSGNVIGSLLLRPATGGEEDVAHRANLSQLWVTYAASRLSTVDGSFASFGVPDSYSALVMDYDPVSFAAIRCVALRDRPSLSCGEVYEYSVETGAGCFSLSWYPAIESDFAALEVTVNPGSIVRTLTYGGSMSMQTDSISGLTNGVKYSVTIKTVDVAGNKSTGLTFDVTPTAEVSGVRVRPGDGKLTVFWDDPAMMDTLKSVRVSCNGVSQDVPKGFRSAVFDGLTNGTPYPVSVKTVDASDVVSSGISVSGTPVAIPGGESRIFELWSGPSRISWGPTVHSPAEAGTYTQIGVSTDIEALSSDTVLTYDVEPAGKWLCFFVRGTFVKIDSIEYLDASGNVIGKYYDGSVASGEVTHSGSNRSNDWQKASLAAAMASADGNFRLFGAEWEQGYAADNIEYSATSSVKKVRFTLLKADYTP